MEALSAGGVNQFAEKPGVHPTHRNHLTQPGHDRRVRTSERSSAPADVPGDLSHQARSLGEHPRSCDQHQPRFDVQRSSSDAGSTCVLEHLAG